MTDNDLALGRIVEALSKRQHAQTMQKYWYETLKFNFHALEASR
jgi:hypothetical protein